MSKVQRFHIEGTMFGHEFTTHYVLASDYDACNSELGYRLAERDALRTQLSAAEARLVKAKEWMQHQPGCHLPLSYINQGYWRQVCTCGLQAFLEGL